MPPDIDSKITAAANRAPQSNKFFALSKLDVLNETALVNTNTESISTQSGPLPSECPSHSGYDNQHTKSALDL